MKKILIALPVILCIIISVCVPLVSTAEEASLLDYFPLSTFQTNHNFTTDDRYFYATYKRNIDSNYTYSVYSQFEESDISSFNDDNGVITITFFEDQSLFRVTNTSSLVGSPSFSDEYSYSFRIIVIDTNVNNCKFLSHLGSVEFPMFGDEIFYDYETNIRDFNPVPDVYVEFNPDLNGTVSRDILINGNAGKLSSISMFIENRSSFNIQYKVEINKANQNNSRWDYESPDNYSRDNLSSSFDDDPVFVYYSNQQVYSHVKTDNNIPGFGYHSPTSLYTKASYFHKLDKGQSETVSFPLSMINLSENVDYRVIVTAYKLDYQYVTEATFPLDPDNVDKSNFEYDSSIFLVAYDSVFRFSDLSGVKYNPNQTSGNILSYDGSNGISDQKKYHVNYDAVTDLETGETKIGHVDNFNSDDYWDSIGVPFQDKHNTFTESFDSSIDLSSFSSLFSPVFGAVGIFFNFLPPSISMIFIFGFTCLVVIAIIKAVKS